MKMSEARAYASVFAALFALAIGFVLWESRGPGSPNEIVAKSSACTCPPYECIANCEPLMAVFRDRGLAGNDYFDVVGSGFDNEEFDGTYDAFVVEFELDRIDHELWKKTGDENVAVLRVSSARRISLDRLLMGLGAAILFCGCLIVSLIIVTWRGGGSRARNAYKPLQG